MQSFNSERLFYLLPEFSPSLHIRKSWLCPSHVLETTENWLLWEAVGGDRQTFIQCCCFDKQISRKTSWQLLIPTAADLVADQTRCVSEAWGAKLIFIRHDRLKPHLPCHPIDPHRDRLSMGLIDFLTLWSCVWLPLLFTLTLSFLMPSHLLWYSTSWSDSNGKYCNRANRCRHSFALCHHFFLIVIESTFTASATSPVWAILLSLAPV